MSEGGSQRSTPPAGSAATVTFLITDIEGSTRLWEEHREPMAVALETHDRLLRTAVEDHGGSVVKSTGDGMLAVFADPRSAVDAAVAAQRALAHQAWGSTGPLRVRMAIHVGEAETRQGDYYGPTVNRVSRLLAIGHGGQMLVSGATATLLGEALPGTITLLDRGEHRLRDLDRPEHVFQVAAPDLQASFPALRSLGAYRTNLPSQLTSFVGRERELEALRAMALAHRIVTLIGTGGTGKTRLMIQAGAELLDHYPDGVWLVELAAVSDPELVPQEIGRALGVSEEPGRSTLDSVSDFCRSKTLLLLLDNCEHLVGAVADAVDRLLSSCPTLAVVATSREALGTPGETVFQVPSLGLPEVDSDQEELTADDAARIVASEAARLFIDRATAALPAFALTPAQAASIGEICRRLDGIPLAIELAAARVTVLSVEEIADGLSDRFRLLTGGRRTALPRQQTLQALIDWSWDLLTDDDRRLLGRLSVFAWGWTLDAATSVTRSGDEPVSPLTRLATLDGLSRLVDRSLVLVDHEGATRYRMLETIRQYAREKLIATGEMGAMRDRHLDWFAELAAASDVALRGPEMIRWLAVLDVEIDNLRSALDWAADMHTERAVRLTVALLPYWRSRAFGPEAVARLTRGAELAVAIGATDGDRDRTILVSRMFSATAFAQAAWGTGPLGREYADRALALARTVDDSATMAEALSAVGMSATFSGSDEPLTPLMDAAIEAAKGQSNWFSIASIESGAALEAVFHGDLAAAETRLAAATEAAEQSGNPFARAFASLGRARALGMAGRIDEARTWFAAAIEAYEQMGDRRFALIARSDFGHALRLSGALDEAEAIYRRTIHDWQHAGSRGAVAHQLECFGLIAVERGSFSRAARLLGAAEALREVAGSPMLFFERGPYGEHVETLRANLAPDAFADAWRAGRAMTSDDAVALALASGAPA